MCVSRPSASGDVFTSLGDDREAQQPVSREAGSMAKGVRGAGAQGTASDGAEDVSATLVRERCAGAAGEHAAALCPFNLEVLSFLTRCPSIGHREAAVFHSSAR